MENDVIVNDDGSIDPVECMKMLAQKAFAESEKASHLPPLSHERNFAWKNACQWLRATAEIANHMRDATKFYRDDLASSLRDLILGEEEID